MALRLSSLRWLQVLRNFAKHSKSCLQRLVGACACILLLDRGCDVIRLPFHVHGAWIGVMFAHVCTFALIVWPKGGTGESSGAGGC